MAAPTGFGAGLGAVIGGMMADDSLQEGKQTLDATAGQFGSTVAPYNSFGQSFLPAAANTIGEVKAKAGEVQGYDQFMDRYEMSPGAAYQLDQGLQAQDASASARGQLLSGTNLRAREGIAQGIASTDARAAYDSYLKGNQQQFGQLETALGNMFGAIGVGTTATGQQAGVTSSQMNNQAALAKAEAENDKGKGGGLGAMFGGLGSLATMF